MTRYTVIYARHALQSLARLWLSASNRAAITQASYDLDRVLENDANLKGIAVGSTYRQLVIGPCIIEFTVEEGDRTVTIWTVRHIGELTNGH